MVSDVLRQVLAEVNRSPYYIPTTEQLTDYMRKNIEIQSAADRTVPWSVRGFRYNW